MTSRATNPIAPPVAAAIPTDLSSHDQPIHEVILRAHARLATRFEDLQIVAWPRQARDLQCRADAMLIDLTRHVNAVRAVAVDEMRAVGDEATADALRAACHGIERTMGWVKARLYGSSTMAHCSFTDLVSELELEVAELVDLEKAALVELRKHHGHDQLLRIGLRLLRVEAHAPTRPHPHLPHQGRIGSISRAIVARTDAIWDSFEGRYASS